MLRRTLSNGLQVIVQENHATKVVAVQIWVRVGSADEQPEEAGLAHVHEHMLFKGTARRAVGAIAAEIEGAGGDINAWTSYDQTVYHVTMASRDFDVALDVLADAVQHSSFDADELAKELEVVLEEVSRGKDTPSRVAFENLFSTAYTTHPYARPVIGTVESVKSFTRDGILAFYRRWYRPRNMCLVVSGDVSAEQVFARAEALFDADDGGELPPRPRTPEPEQESFRWVRASKEIQESHLAVAWPGTPLHHEDTPALDVLSVLLGTGESSRLWRALKRDHQLVNDCYASSYTPQDRGVMMAGATIHGESVEDAYRALLEEVFRLRHTAPSPAEIDKAKTILLADAVYSKETVQGVARKIGYFELVAGDPDYEEVYYAKMREVTPEDVRRVAHQYLRPQTTTVSVLLPEALADRLDRDTAERIALEADSTVSASADRPRFELGPEQVAEVRLTNGVTLLVREDRAVPLISVRAAARGGLQAETPATNGVTHLAGELLVRGTTRYGAEQLTDELDSMASGITGVSGRNSLGLRGDFLQEHWARGMELFASCLLEPVFPEEELERERKSQLEDIASRQDSLSAVAFDQMVSTLWKSHPYGMPVLGTEASVRGLGRAQVVEAFRRQLHPERTVISVVGAVDVADTIGRFERRVGSFAADPDARPFDAPAAEPAPEAPRALRSQRNREQAHLVIGFPGVDMYDERRWPLEVMNSILGGQGGRLFVELRDKQSLCYSVAALSQEGLAPGYFAVYIGTAQDKLAVAEAGIRAQLRLLTDEGVTEAEVERARRYLIGTHEVALQRASARAGAMALNHAYGLGYDAHAHYARHVSGVTAARIREVARDIVRWDRAVLSVVEARSAGQDAA